MNEAPPPVATHPRTLVIEDPVRPPAATARVVDPGPPEDPLIALLRGEQERERHCATCGCA